jgi:hypothetical protein
MTPTTKTQHLKEILKAFGEGKLITSREQFERYCAQFEITEKGIDDWCDENCACCPDDEAADIAKRVA